MTRKDIEIALIGVQRPRVVEELGARFELHHLYAAADPGAMLRDIGPRVRAAAGHGMAGLSRELILAMPRVEICAISGVGLETSDTVLAKERGIVITTAPVLFDDVADLAVALALSACRRIVEGDTFVRAGRWKMERLAYGRKLTGMNVGIIGLGRIGIEVARRLEGFKCSISYVDPHQQHQQYTRHMSIKSLAEACDIVFMCAAGAPKGTGGPMIDSEVINAIGPRGIFVNVARGWLVDESALIDALEHGRLGAAALDVFHDEPDVPERLIALPNVVLTPHVASATEETARAMDDCVIGNIVSWFDGRGALTPIS